MMAIDVLNQMAIDAKDYRTGAKISIHRNKHMNEIDRGEILHQHHIDAVLVDFINYIGRKYGIDYALYTKDIQ